VFEDFVAAGWLPSQNRCRRAFNFGSGPRVNFCPFCGVNLDEPRPLSSDRSAAQNPIKS
jgi:hypothetical protein